MASLNPPRVKRQAARHLLRDLRGPVGFLVLGIGIGGSAFLIYDALDAPAAQTAPTSALYEPIYRSCREALQDGRVNIRRGEPGYRPALDADGDGIACEPFRPR